MLEGLRARLMAPEIAAEAMRAYAEETNRLNRERRADGEAERRELNKITRSIKEIVALVEDGGGSRALLARLRDLEAREAARPPVACPGGHPGHSPQCRRHLSPESRATCRGATTPTGARTRRPKPFAP